MQRFLAIITDLILLFWVGSYFWTYFTNNNMAYTDTVLPLWPLVTAVTAFKVVETRSDIRRLVKQNQITPK